MNRETDINRPETVRGLNATFRMVLSEARRLRSELIWLQDNDPGSAENVDFAQLDAEILAHLAAAEKTIAGLRYRPNRGAVFIGSAMARVHFAEELMLRRGSAAYLLGKLPKIHSDVLSHLDAKDEQRKTFEGLVKCGGPKEEALNGSLRELIISICTAAHIAYRREYARLRSFRNTLLTSSAAMLLIVVALGAWGVVQPENLAPCFYPVEKAKVVCPTNESPFAVVDTADGLVAAAEDDIDAVIRETAQPWDIPLLLFIGMVSAAVAGAPSLRRAKGTATPYGLTVALGLMKLPTGALTAVLGLMLMRGGFVPGLSALDGSAQVLAWAVVFGAAQQLFTRLVDRQGETLIEQVGGQTGSTPDGPAKT